MADVEKTLQNAGYPYQVVSDRDLYRINRQGPMMIGLPNVLNRRLMLEIQAYLADGGRLILLPSPEPLGPNVIQLLEDLGITSRGTLYTPQALPLNTPSRKSLAMLPTGSRVLDIQPTEGSTVLARWGEQYPAVIRSEKGGLVNWRWGSDLSPEVNMAALKAILDKNQSFEAALADEATEESSSPRSEPVAPFGIGPSADSTMAPTPDFEALRPANPQLKEIEAALPEAGGIETVEVPTKTEVFQPEGEQPAHAPETAEGDPLLDESLMAAPQDMGGAATDEDPLFNDALMTGNTGLQTDGMPGSAYEETFSDYGALRERLAKLDRYEKWIEDAIESALQLSVDIPVKKAQQLMIKANIEKAVAEHTDRQGDTWKAEYHYEKAHELLNQALVMTTVSPKVEGRAIWLDRGSIVDSRSPQGLRRLIGKLHDAGINIIYFETFNAGFPMYPSKLLPQNPLVQGWDPLAVAVEEAHKRDMELHAWVWTFAVGNTKHNPLISKTEDYAGPVLEEAGLMSEAMRTVSGGIMPPGQTEYWLSPASPTGRRFLKDLYKEIVTKYDVDGLQLDYIRYPFQRPATQSGYEPVSINRFRQETGQAPGGSDYAYKSFIAWKTLQVNTFVEELSGELKGARSNLKLSAAVFPMPRTQRILAIQQDWETWVQRGWVDTLSPMIYTSSQRIFEETVSRILQDTGKKAMVYPGVAIFRLDSSEMLGHLNALRRRGAMGSTLFAFAQLDKTKQAALKEGPYKQKAQPPHRSPQLALNALVSDFRLDFNKLATKGELASTLTDGEVRLFQEALDKLAALTDPLKPGLPEGDVMNTLTLAARQLNEKTREWATREQQSRPFLAQLFSEYVMRIDQMVDYSRQAGPATISRHREPLGSSDMGLGAKPSE